MRNRVAFGLWGATLAVFASASVSRADENDVDRVARIQRALDDVAPGAVRWRSGWMIAQGALAIGQGAVALAIHDQGQRRSWWIGAGESVVGFGAVALIPCPAESAGDDLRGMGPTKAATRRAYAEKLLDDSADAQEQTRGWLAQAGNFVVAAAGASILWFAYKQRTDAVVSFVESMAVGELQILTAPTAAIEARRAYRSSVAVSVALIPGGISLAGTF